MIGNLSSPNKSEDTGILSEGSNDDIDLHTKVSSVDYCNTMDSFNEMDGDGNTPFAIVKDEMHRHCHTTIEPVIQNVKTEMCVDDMNSINNAIDVGLDEIAIQCVKDHSSAMFSAQAQDPLNYKTNIGNDDDDDGVDDYDDLVNCVKDEIEIDETPMFSVKQEFHSDVVVEPITLKVDPIEPKTIWNSLQFFYNLELKLCGGIAVVSLSKLEDVYTDSVHSPSEIKSELQDEDFQRVRKIPLVGCSSRHDELSDLHDEQARENRTLLKSLREYRMEKVSTKTRCREQKATAGKGSGPFEEDFGAIKHRNIKLYECSLCRFSCSTKTNLERHLRKHTGKDNFCTVCGYKSQTASYLLIHARKHTGEKPFECDTCDYKAIQIQHLIRHKRKHTGEKPFVCTIEGCNYKGIDSGSLTRHMRVHTGEKPFSCKMCHSKFSRKSRLKEHEMTHRRHLPNGEKIDEKPFSCKMCHSKFSRKCHLKEHEMTHRRHLPNGEKIDEETYNCDDCQFKTTRLKYLTIHKRIHMEENPFSCTFCNYKCCRSGDLNKHIKIHTGEKPFKCDTCGYRSIRLNQLKQHIRRHTGEKPFKCEMCDSRFSRSSDLNSHRKAHTHTFKCDVCNRSFSKLYSLNMHKKIHSGAKLYCCDICDFKSYRKHSLEQHVRIHARKTVK